MTLNTDHRFALGDNWEKFSNNISKAQIDESVENLKRIIQASTLDHKSFLDIGCGSGLHTLAAIQLGAETVSAFDIDPQSVGTTKKHISTYAPNFKGAIEQKSIFDTFPEPYQRTFDVVYSWGVLHHTGDMWTTLRKASVFVAPEGKLIIAIYKKSPLCRFCKIEKSVYSRLPSILQFPIKALFSILYLSALLIKGTNPAKYVKSYQNYQGMNFWHDMIDWIGGLSLRIGLPGRNKALFPELGIPECG